MKLIIALALLAHAGIAEAAEPPCITEPEFRSAGLFMLPTVIESAADRCQKHLPAGAYLLTGARRLGEAVARDRDRHKQAALAAFARLGGEKLPEGLSADTVAGLVTDMARAELMKKVNAAECARIDEAAALLAPLPPENLIGLLGLMMRIGMEEDKKPPFRICAAPKP